MRIATVNHEHRPDQVPLVPADGPRFQAIPLYLPSDRAVAQYLRDHESELNDLSGEHLTVVIVKALQTGDTGWIGTMFGPARLAPRYPGLKLTDLPCLWLEDHRGGHVVIRLTNSVLRTTDLLRGVVEACRGAPSAAEVKRRYNGWVEAEGLDRSVLAREIREAGLAKSTERLIALICGVVFMVAILVIAFVLPTPTPWQQDIFRIVLAVAAAGFASMIDGFLNVTFGTWAKAGGAFAVFLIVFLLNPASRDAPTAVPPEAPPAAAPATGG